MYAYNLYELLRIEYVENFFQLRLVLSVTN